MITCSFRQFSDPWDQPKRLIWGADNIDSARTTQAAREAAARTPQQSQKPEDDPTQAEAAQATKDQFKDWEKELESGKLSGSNPFSGLDASQYDQAADLLRMGISELDGNRDNDLQEMREFLDKIEHQLKDELVAGLDNVFGTTEGVEGVESADYYTRGKGLFIGLSMQLKRNPLTNVSSIMTDLNQILAAMPKANRDELVKNAFLDARLIHKDDQRQLVVKEGSPFQGKLIYEGGQLHYQITDIEQSVQVTLDSVTNSIEANEHPDTQIAALNYLIKNTYHKIPVLAAVQRLGLKAPNDPDGYHIPAPGNTYYYDIAFSDGKITAIESPIESDAPAPAETIVSEPSDGPTESVDTGTETISPDFRASEPTSAPAAMPSEPAAAPADESVDEPTEDSAPESSEVASGEFLEISGKDVEDWIGNIATKYGTTIEQIEADNPGKIKTVAKAGGGFERRHIGKQYVMARETLLIRKAGTETDSETTAEPAETVATPAEEAPAEEAPAEEAAAEEAAAEEAPAEEAPAEEADETPNEHDAAREQYRVDLAAHMEETFPGLEVSADSIQITTSDVVDDVPRKAQITITATYKGKTISMEASADPSNINDPVKEAENRLLQKLDQFLRPDRQADQQSERQEAREAAMAETEELGDALDAHRADVIRNLEARYPDLDIQIQPKDIRVFVSNRVDGHPQEARVRLQATVNGTPVALEAKGSASDMIDSHDPVHAASRNVILGLLPEYRRVKRAEKQATRKEGREAKRADRIEAREQREIDSAISKGEPIIEKIKTKLVAGKPIDGQMYLLNKITDNIDDWGDYEEVLKGLGFFQKPGLGPNLQILHINGSQFLEANFDEEASESITLVDLGTPEAGPK